MRGSSDSDETIVSVGSSGSRTELLATARRRFLRSPSPNAFLTPAFTAAASAGGSISNSPLDIDPSLLRFTQSRFSRLHFSSSSSSNESPGSSSPSAAAVAARMRLQQLLKLKSSLSTSSRRGSTLSPLSPIDNLQTPPFAAMSSPSYSIYKTPMKMMEEDVLVMDALAESVPMQGRTRQPLELFTSSSSSSSVNNNSVSANFLKNDICRSWEECGFCRFGSRCQFAHGKEEIRDSPRPSKLKPESGKRGSTIGSSIYCDKYVRSEGFDSTSVAPVKICKTDSKKIKIINMSRVSSVMKNDLPFTWPPTEGEEDEIQQVLYGPNRRGIRLSVFTDMCPDPD